VKRFPSPPADLKAALDDLGGTVITYLGEATQWPELEFPGVQALHECLTGHGLTLEAEYFLTEFVDAMDRAWTAATEGNVAPPTVASLLTEVCTPHGFHVPEDALESAVLSFCRPIAAGARVVAGAPEVLAWLHGHDVKLGLISNTVWPASAHREDLARFGLLDYFDVTVFSSETDLWKPDPRIFQRALDALNADPATSIVVGDRLMEDIHGAQQLGLRTVFFHWKDEPRDPGYGRVQPHATVESLLDLPLAIGRVWRS